MPLSCFISLEDNLGSRIFSSNVTPNIYVAYYENVFLYLGLYVTVSLGRSLGVTISLKRPALMTGLCCWEAVAAPVVDTCVVVGAGSSLLF